MSNKTYDILKWIGTVVLAAVTTFAAALLGISSVKYQLELKKGGES